MHQERPPDIPNDYEWLRALNRAIWSTDAKFSAKTYGFRKPLRRLNRNELDRILRIVEDPPYVCHLTKTDEMMLVILGPGANGSLERLLTLAWHHVPSGKFDTRHRRLVASNVFSRLVFNEKNGERLERYGLAPKRSSLPPPPNPL